MNVTIDPSPITQDGLSVLVQNFNNARPLADRIDGINFTYSAPVANVASGDPRKTIVRVRPISTSGLISHIVINYSRINLSTLSDYTHVAGGALKVSDIIGQINDKYGILLNTGDYSNPNLPLAGSSVTVVINPSCYLFIGQFTVNVV